MQSEDKETSHYGPLTQQLIAVCSTDVEDHPHNLHVDCRYGCFFLLSLQSAGSKEGKCLPFRVLGIAFLPIGISFLPIGISRRPAGEKVRRPPSRWLSSPVNAPHVDIFESRIKEELIALGLFEPQEV